MPVKRTVTARVPAKDGQPEKVASITITDGETAEEQIKMFGDAAVRSNASSNWDVTLQSAIRSGLRRGETQEQLQARLGEAKMGVKIQKAAADPEAAFLAKYQAASPAERKAMMKKLQELAA